MTHRRYKNPRNKKTKIVCTLGPSSNDPKVLEEMILSGMDIVRLNFSHGDYSEDKSLFEIIRTLSAKYSHQIGIICDIQGPKIRTGEIREPFELRIGDTVDVTPLSILGTKEAFQIRYDKLLEDLKSGDDIFVNDGLVKLVVQKINPHSLTCLVESGGVISNAKGCNIPACHLSVDVVTPKDRNDLKAIAELNPEWVACSFIGSAADVENVRATLKEFGNSSIKIISKIERPEGLRNLDEIIEATDALMVARGDLGVEINTWEVPVAQKEMCRKCNSAGKPVVVATQMLESMTTSSRPTRAEASDVFNAVLDGADAVMLSEETAVGRHPVEVVRIMSRMVARAEEYIPPRHPKDFNSKHVGMTETVALGSYNMAINMGLIGFSGKIIVITGPPSAYTVRMVSKFRPPLGIIAIAEDLRTTREANLIWGVRACYDENLKKFKDMEERNVSAVRKALRMNWIDKEDHVLVVSRSVLGKHVGATTAIYFVKELIERNIYI